VVTSEHRMGTVWTVCGRTCVVRTVLLVAALVAGLAAGGFSTSTPWPAIAPHHIAPGGALDIPCVHLVGLPRACYRDGTARKQADSLSAERQRHRLPRCGSRVELWTLEVQFGHGAVPGAVGHGPGGLNGAAGRPMEWFGIPFHFCFNSTHATAPLHFTDDAMIRNLFI
jgi:hypothetical protein